MQALFITLSVLISPSYATTLSNFHSTPWYGQVSDLDGPENPDNYETINLVELSSVQEFSDLHLTENLKAAVKALEGLSGIYCLKCLTTGTMYIGSSTVLGERLSSHIMNSSNVHLRNAIEKYGIKNFVFIVVEYVEIISDLSQAPRVKNFFRTLPTGSVLNPLD